MSDFSLIIFASVAFIFIGVLLSSMILLTKAKLAARDSVKIKINEDESLTKEVSGGDTLLSILGAEGISLPSPCGGKATCKQCKVRVVEGGGEPLETDKATFSPKELKEGWRLSCQFKLRQDVGLKIPEALLDLKEIEGIVISNDNVATFIKELIVEVPENAISYKPGDYMQFVVPPFSTNTSDWKQTMDPKFYSDWEAFHLFDKNLEFKNFEDQIVRAYSMASYPKEGNVLKFNVRIATPPLKKDQPINVSWGVCSSYIFSLEAGDKVKLTGPFGESHMIEDDRPIYFLIGGAGSSFGRSHIMDLFYGKNTKRKVSLWYGARSLKENIYEEDFRVLEEQFENFSYHLVLSQPTEEDINAGWPKDDPTKTAFLFKAFKIADLDRLEEPENCLYYVCGPPMHNQSILKLLDDYGVPKENVVLDDFGS